MIASDGKGPYEGGVDGVQTYSTKIFNRDVYVIQTGSRRSVWIYFSDAHWMNESMGSMPPRFPSRQYMVDFTIYAVPSGMEIGERQSPTVQITLYDPDARFDSANLPSTYGQNRLEMVRASQDKWTLDVDAWFMGYDLPITQSPFPTYYVRISFTMTMQAVPSYIFTG